MENNNTYTIGDKEYSREELLTFGKHHYPKFYWISRGIGIFLMFMGFLFGLGCLLAGILRMNNGAELWEQWIYYGNAIWTLLMGIVGVIVFAVSFKPLPDESYIKHAADYYTKLDLRNKKRAARATQKEEKKDLNQLIKYKELLDKGVITPEEYEAKKKELL